MISISLSSSSLIHASVSFSLLFIPSSVQHLNVLYSSSLFSLYFLILYYKLLTSCYGHPLFSEILWSSLQPLPSTLSQVDFLSPLHLVIFPEFYLVPSFGICSSVVSFYLVCCCYLYVSRMLIMFLNFGEMTFCRKYPMYPNSAFLFGHLN